MGTLETDQPPLWIATSDLPTSHPFYARLTTLLDGHHFDRFVEGLCARFYAPVMGRPSLAPGRYFRLLLVGYFEGIDSERGMASTDSLAVRTARSFDDCAHAAFAIWRRTGPSLRGSRLVSGDHLTPRPNGRC